MSEEEIALKEFDPASMPNDVIALFIGIRNSGKTTTVEDVIFHKQSDFGAAVAVSATEGANKFYSRFLPESFVHEDFTLGLIGNLWQRQKAVKSSPPAIDGRPSGSFRNNLLLVLDDLMAESQQIFNHGDVKAMFMNGRHYGFCLFILVQYLKSLSPALRLNTDYIFVFREDNIEIRKQLYQLVGTFDTFAKFCQCLTFYTDKYGCLVFNKRAKSNNLTDKVFWYRANPNHGEWKIDAPDMWAFHKEHFIGEKEEDVFDWSQGVFPSTNVSETNNSKLKSTSANKRNKSANIKSQPFGVLHRFDKHGNPTPDD